MIGHLGLPFYLCPHRCVFVRRTVHEKRTVFGFRDWNRSTPLKRSNPNSSVWVTSREQCKLELGHQGDDTRSFHPRMAPMVGGKHDSRPSDLRRGKAS